MLSLHHNEGDVMRKILVVDDEASVRSLLANALNAAGNDVFEAEDAGRALELAEEHHFFDLVITDILMPGMGGIELARRMILERSARRFLFISGYTQMDTIDPDLE